MVIKERLPQNKSYETTEMKLVAVLISEIPECALEVYLQGNSIKKTIRVTYPAKSDPEVNQIIREYIERHARVDVYKYNMALNLIRDKIRRE